MDRAGKTYAMIDGPVIVTVLSSRQRPDKWVHEVLILQSADPRQVGGLNRMHEWSGVPWDATYEEIGSHPT